MRDHTPEVLPGREEQATPPKKKAPPPGAPPRAPGVAPAKPAAEAGPLDVSSDVANAKYEKLLREQLLRAKFKAEKTQSLAGTWRSKLPLPPKSCMHTEKE